MIRHITVLGLGAAGLAATRALAAIPKGPRLTLVEEAGAIGHDRTWCSWFPRHEARALDLPYQWPQWRVAGAGRDLVRSARDTVYGGIGSAAFADNVLGPLQDRRDIDIRFGTRAGAVTPTARGLRVETAAGDLETDLVLDSRPHAPRPAGSADVSLQQRFVGWEIRTSRPVFDPGVATVMDFRDGPDVHFVYVLPFAADHALVEDTWIVPRDFGDIDHEAGIRAYIGETHGDVDYEVVRFEAGSLPMSTRAPAPTGHVLHKRVGVAGGWMRPSTGYSFRHALNNSRSLAWAVKKQRIDVGDFRRPGSLAYLDRVFLRFLRDQPEMGAEAFVRLFERTDPAALVRFLEGEPDVHALRDVIGALPPRPLVMASMRSTAALVG